MDIQVATLCDAAMDYNQKLCILGTFDTICAASLPVVHPQCALAMRICFRPEDEGEHKFTIRIIDADGKSVIPTLEPTISIHLPDDGYFLTRNLILNLHRLQFKETGQFCIDITVDGEMLTRIPLRVMLVERKNTDQLK